MSYFDQYLNKRSLKKTDGRMLFRYKTSITEYQEIRQLFNDQINLLCGQHWKFNSREECALFVLYAAEWWRREYNGGAWKWTSIFESLTQGKYQIDPQDRSEAIERGMYAWKLPISSDGKKYFGTIVANGGLPLKMLAHGDGSISKLLLGATRKAQFLGWNEQDLKLHFKSHEQDLISHLRRSEIHDLLASMVFSVLELRNEYKLAGINNPVEVLEQRLPNWRDKFPISIDVEDTSIEPLLRGMVKEAARQVTVKISYPVIATRTLVKSSIENGYQLIMSLDSPKTMSLKSLAEAMGIDAEEKIPHSFSIELLGDLRISLAQGRKRLGTNTNDVFLSSRPQRFINENATKEILLTIRTLGHDISPPSSIPNGQCLEYDQPWCFIKQNETWTFLTVGSCKTRDESIIIAINKKTKISKINETKIEALGNLSGFENPMHFFKIQGMVEVLFDNVSYTIQTSTNETREELIWKGKRFEYPSIPFPVFYGLPRLYKINEEGELHPISEKYIEWVCAKQNGEKIEKPRKYIGSLDAWLLSNGRRQRRFRMAIIDSNALISMKSGANEFEGLISFQGWNTKSAHMEQEGITLEKTAAENTISLRLSSANEKPPTQVDIFIEWRPDLPLVQLTLPFPSAGGRFSKIDGTILSDNAQCSLNDLHNLRLQVFDQNPTSPKRYHLQIILGEQEKKKLIIPLNSNGFGEIRFFEIESLLLSIFSQSDSLDAELKLYLIKNEVRIRCLRLARYDISLKLEPRLKEISIDFLQLKDVSIEKREQITLKAIPLLKKEGMKPLCLTQISSEGAPTGCWSVEKLPTTERLWLIYSSEESSIQIRPMLWVSEILDFERKKTLLSVTSYDLATAMEVPSQLERDKAITFAMKAMIIDWNKPCWKIIENQYPLLKHLPLNTLDYWRVFSKDMNACLALVLRLSLSQPSEIATFMLRMQNELGVIWELTSKKHLERAWELFSKYLSTLLKIDSTHSILINITIDIFRKIGLISESILIQVECIIFDKTRERSQLFDKQITEFKKTPDCILRELWVGENALVQVLLLRSHNEFEIWPSMELAKNILSIALSIPDTQKYIETEKSIEFLKRFMDKLLFQPSSKKTSDVSNAPFLVGFFIQFESTQYWFKPEWISQLREIRNFDKEWFDIAIKYGNLLAMKAKEQQSKELYKR